MSKNNEQKINITGWQPIEEYFREAGRYDWVLVKYFDEDYECVPDVMEYRHPNTEKAGWYNRTDHKLEDCFTPKYFFNMQQLDEVTFYEDKKDE